MTKTQYDMYHSMGLSQTAPGEIIKQLANRLLQSLYIPVKDERQWIKDKHLVMNEEPINWGDLSATVEVICEGRYLVIIEEASPDNCPELCNYIQQYLEAWGWDVEIRTEW